MIYCTLLLKYIIIDPGDIMWLYTRTLIYCHLLMCPTLTFSFEQEWKDLKIVDDISLDHEEDDSIYRKNMFQPTSFLSPGLVFFLNT